MSLISWNDLLLGNLPERWLQATSILLLGWLLAKSISWFGSVILLKLASRSANTVDDALVVALRRPVVVLVTVLSFVVGYQQLQFTERVDLWMYRVFHVAVALAVTWTFARAMDAIIHAFLGSRKADGQRSDKDQLIPTIRSGVKILIWGLGVVVALNNAGYDVSALLAGIGIGGLALAMAAKDSVANIFGGITVFTDKPFRTGDRIRIEGHDGVVQEVGIRSTRIKTLQGPTVVVPNFKFTDSVVENVTMEPSRRVAHELGLVYETSPARMEEALAILNGLVNENQMILTEERSVSFTAFKDFSLGIQFIYYIRKDADIFATQTRIHLEIMRRFAAAGLEFAYPTQVEYSR